MIHFAYNRSSWNEVTNEALPDSMAARIAEPIQQELSARGVEFTIGREPREGQLNLYSSARSAYRTKGKPIGERSVLLSHGIADKGIRHGLAGQYGYVVAPSPRLAETMTARGVHPRHVVTLGYPKLDPLYQGLIAPLPRDERIRVLYAPTQGGGGDMDHMHDTAAPAMEAAKRSSWWRRDEIFKRLDPDIFDVVFCPHPRYAPGHRATLEEYVGADVVIADGGSTLWEALALDIPLVVPRWITGEGHRGHKTMEGLLYAENVGRHVDVADDLAKTVREAAEVGPGELETHYGELALPCELRGRSGRLHAKWLVDIGDGFLK